LDSKYQDESDLVKKEKKEKEITRKKYKIKKKEVLFPLKAYIISKVTSTPTLYIIDI
jgi:hypothetical protein